MISRENIIRFRKKYGEQIMCSGNYSNAKRAFRDALYLSDHIYTRYMESYPVEMKRPKQDIIYMDARATGNCPIEFQTLWSMPTVKSYARISSNNQITLNMQISTCLFDCIIWAHIIHTHKKGLLTGKPTENLLCWLFFKYVGVYYTRDGAGTWTTGLTYNQILDVLLPCSHNLAISTKFQDSMIQQRNLMNYKARYKKNDGDIYVLKSQQHYDDNKHSNSATCQAKYTDEEMNIICNEGIGRNEVARRLNALGYKICPSTVTNVRNRLKRAKEQASERWDETDDAGPLE